ASATPGTGRSSLLYAGGLPHLGDVGIGEAPVGQRLVGVLPRNTWRAADLGWSAAEPGRRRRLLDPRHLDERLAGDIVRMLRGLVHRQHRREAGVGVLHQGAPLVARLRLEDRGQA